MAKEKNTQLLDIFLVFLVMIFVGRIQELIPFLHHSSVGIIVVISLFILIVFSPYHKYEIITWLSYPQVKYILFIAVMILLSVPGSVWPSKSLEFFLNYYIKMMIFIYLIITITNSKRKLYILFFSLVLSVFTLCIVAIINPLNASGRLQETGTYDPNDIALFLTIAIPIIYALSESVKGLRKYLLYGIIAFAIKVILSTGSRGGLLSLLAVVIAILINRRGKNFIKNSIFAVFLLVLIVIFSKPHLDRYITITDLRGDYNIESIGGRLQIWKNGILLIKDNPFLGNGAGVFHIAQGAKIEGAQWMTAHNSFIQIGAELGVFALFAHIWIIWEIGWRSHKNSDFLSIGIRNSLIAYVIGGIFLSWAYVYIFYYLLSLSIAYNRICVLSDNESLL